jgi:hypothetical protein
VTSLATLTDTAALAVVVAAFILAFWLTLALTRAQWLSDAAGGIRLDPAAIAASYLIALPDPRDPGVVWLPSLLVDPLVSLAPDWAGSR